MDIIKNYKDEKITNILTEFKFKMFMGDINDLSLVHALINKIETNTTIDEFNNFRAYLNKEGEALPLIKDLVDQLNLRYKPSLMSALTLALKYDKEYSAIRSTEDTPEKELQWYQSILGPCELINVDNKNYYVNSDQLKSVLVESLIGIEYNPGSLTINKQNFEK